MNPHATQFALPGIAPGPDAKSTSALKSPKPTRKFGGMPDRLFFGLLLDAAAAYDAEQAGMKVQRENRLQTRLRPKRLFHVSLQALGDFNGLPSGLVEMAREAAESVAMPPFEVRFEHVMSLNTCIVLAGGDGVSGVRMLEHALGKALQIANLGGPSRHFNPHVTLIYDRTVVSRQPLARPIRWTVHDFVLIHSLQRQSTYIPLKTFALSA
jgi:2'-5' RNA ligase